jgi:hypothetical protein
VGDNQLFKPNSTTQKASAKPETTGLFQSKSLPDKFPGITTQTGSMQTGSLFGKPAQANTELFGQLKATA